MFGAGYAAHDAELEQRFAFSDDVRSVIGNRDRVNAEDIRVYSDRVELDLAGVKYAPISATNSMLPLLHEGSHSLEQDVTDVGTLDLGDVISFYEPSMQRVVIHSIVELGWDDIGWFAVTKGLSNPTVDPWKVREDWIHGVLIGVLY